MRGCLKESSKRECWKGLEVMIAFQKVLRHKSHSSFEFVCQCPCPEQKMKLFCRHNMSELLKNFLATDFPTKLPEWPKNNNRQMLDYLKNSRICIDHQRAKCKQHFTKPMHFKRILSDKQSKHSLTYWSECLSALVSVNNFRLAMGKFDSITKTEQTTLAIWWQTKKSSKNWLCNKSQGEWAHAKDFSALRCGQSLRQILAGFDEPSELSKHNIEKWNECFVRKFEHWSIPSDCDKMRLQCAVLHQKPQKSRQSGSEQWNCAICDCHFVLLFDEQFN